MDDGSGTAPSTAIPTGIRALLAVRFLVAAAVVGQVTVVGKQVFDITGSELDLGLLGLAEFLPTALLSPVTGSVADRLDRRRVMAAGLAGQLATAAGLALYATTDPTAVGPIFGLVAGFGVARAFTNPASRALPVDLAPPHLLERVIALSSVTLQAGVIVGPVLAGFLYVAGPPVSFAVGAGLLGVAVVVTFALVPSSSVARLRSTPGARAAVRDAVEGLRFVRRTPLLFGAISLDLFAVLFGGAIALLPAIAEERLGVGAVGLGWLRAATGIGAAATGLVLARRPVTRRIGRVLYGVVALFGVGTIVLGLTRSYVVAFAMVLVLSGADAVSVYIRATIVPLATPEAMRGRVLAVENVFIGASNELGAFESGVAGHFLGLVGAVVSGGVATLVVVAVWWRWFPHLRDVDRFHDVRPERPGPVEPMRPAGTDTRMRPPSGQDTNMGGPDAPEG